VEAGHEAEHDESALLSFGMSKLNEGQQIEFELEDNRGKATAVNLKVK
jgi:cold shock CspA family protein